MFPPGSKELYPAYIADMDAAFKTFFPPEDAACPVNINFAGAVHWNSPIGHIDIEVKIAGGGDSTPTAADPNPGPELTEFDKKPITEDYKDGTALYTLAQKQEFCNTCY